MEDVKKCVNDGLPMSHAMLKIPIHFVNKVTYVGVEGWYCQKCGSSVVTGRGFSLGQENLKELGIDRSGL